MSGGGLNKSMSEVELKDYPRIISFEIREFQVGKELIPRLVMYVRAGNEIKDLYIDIDPNFLDTYTRTIEGRKQLLKAILETLTKEYPIYNNIGYLIEITNDPSIIENIEKAYKEYRVRKTGILVEEYKIPIPEKARVFLERELARLDQYILIIYELGKGYKKIGPIDPITYYNIRRADKSSVFIQLKLGDINPEKAKMLPQVIPWIHFYKSNNMIILSYEALRLGENELRLLPIDMDYIDKLLEKLTVSDKAALLKALKKVLVRVSEEEKIGDKEAAISNELRQLIMDNIEKFVLAETGLDRETTLYLINNYHEYLNRVFNNIEGDELVINFYKAMSLPYFEPLYAPHTLLATSTNAGKTLLYTLLVDEKGPFTRITSMTLVGGIGPDKKPVRGVLDKRQYAIQIESLEEEEAKKVLSYAIDYMKSGRAISGVYGKVIRAEGSAPIILTANIVKRGKAYTIQDWIRKGLLDNPEALGSRLLFFYKETEQLRIKNKKELFEASEILRELFRSTSVKRKLRNIWLNDKIREWLEIPDSLDINIREVEKELSVLHHYLDVLAKNFYRKLRGLALNTALFDMLDLIYTNKVDDIVDQILEKANQYYEFFKEELRKSILSALEEIILKDPTSLALSLPKLLKKMIVIIDRYQNETATIIQDKVSIRLSEIIDFLVQYGYAKQNEKPVYKQRLVKYLRDNKKPLSTLGIFYVEEDGEIVIVVDNNMFKALNIDEIAKDIEGGGRS